MTAAAKRDIADILKSEGPAGVHARLDRDLGASRNAAALNATLDVFDHWLLLADPTPIYAVLGAVAGNFLSGVAGTGRTAVVGEKRNSQLDIDAAAHGASRDVDAGCAVVGHAEETARQVQQRQLAPANR